MKKTILFFVAFLAIVTPKIALSQEEAFNFSEEESALISPYICSDHNLSLDEIEAELTSQVGSSLSSEKIRELASFAMSGKQMPEEMKNLICE